LNSINFIAHVFFIFALHFSVVGMNTVQSVTFAERPAFYREKQSEMYSPLLYVATNTLVEIPYILVSSLLFVIPFFFIIGLDEGAVVQKLLWYWVFMSLLLCSLVFAGQFFAVLLPTEAAAGGEATCRLLL
jgi:ABC-type multidrug transport system permease subunit